MIFELAGDDAFNGPVAAIMDAGRHFVEHRAILAGKEFQCQNADIIKCVGYLAGQRLCFIRLSRNQRSSRNSGKRQNAIPMHIIGTGPETNFRSEEHTSELQSLMRTSYAVFCLKKKKTNNKKTR